MLNSCYIEDEGITRDLVSWLEIDQMIRLLTIIFTITMVCIASTLQSKHRFTIFKVFCFGNLAFFLYQLIWHIEGIIIFGYMLRKSLSSPIKCSTNYEGYMIVSSSLGTVLILLNIILTFVRPFEDNI